MHLAYVAVTVIAALANGWAACLNFAGAGSVRAVAERVQVSPKWMIPFGTLLAAGSIGLICGLAVPAVGTAAAIGLLLYFILALSAHLRVRDPGTGGAILFLALAASAVVANLADHDHW